MAKQTINQGTAPTGAGGDTFRSGSAKLQANDNELYSQLGATAQGVLPAALPINKGGTGATTAAAARTALGLGGAATKTVGTSSGNIPEYAISYGLSGMGYGGAAATAASGVDFYSNKNGLASGFYLLDSSNGVPANTASRFVIRAAYGVNRNHLGFEISNRPYSNRYFLRACSSSAEGAAWLAEAEIYHSSNTTKDSNGFIKAASPIVQLFANNIELNDLAQQQNIIFEKLDVGDYLIKGSLGFAQEGWYVEQPKDANGNVLVAIVYKQLENNDISVKTYKKKFDIETASIVADLDKPVDIPQGRWIDLRLQELPQPLIEMEEELSNTPSDFQPTGIAQAVQEMMYGAE